MNLSKKNTIAIMCHKGGTAKTTTVSNLAGYFANILKKRVLIIDTDEQSNIKTVFGLKLSESEGGLASILLDNLNPEELIQKTKYPNIDIILSGGKIIRQLESHFSQSENRFLLMQKKLSVLKNKYDLILIDTSPALSLVGSNVIAFSDYVLLPTSPELLGVVGVKSTITCIEHFEKDLKSHGLSIPEVLGIVLTLFDTRRSLDMSTLDELDNLCSNYPNLGQLFNPIRMDTKVRTAQHRRKHLFDSEQNSRAAQDYATLGNAIYKKIFDLEQKNTHDGQSVIFNEPQASI